ncbi:ABC transporter permease subunit [Paenibacillus sp. LMG 31460]|uniref:ABC transporter permease subunit n=1 Tax=Paenibacillus germinis TaxID=2654979 RepID=A0ABX1Z4Z6_9BACL|nr:sugar ABC transporter permease [Paenibacillus germinis]NOU88342.1 ABC transporter permease subunit [Paenibacillus germinis]
MNMKKIYPMYFLIVPIGIYTLLYFIPSLFSFYYSLTDWNTFTDDVKFVGLDNFKQMITEGRVFVKYLENTAGFALFTTLLKNVLGLLLALLLHEGLKSKNVLRTLFYLPVTISPLIIGLIFSSVFDANHGIINSVLTAIGLESWTHGWLVDIKFALASVITVETWKFVGFNMIIYLAGLQTIDKSYYEAASMDGANAWSRFWNVTLPLILPALTINLVLNLINGFKVFDLIFVLTKGGPGNATEVLNTAVFREFSAGRYGLATAYGVLVFLLTTVVALSALSILSRKSEVEA